MTRTMTMTMTTTRKTARPTTRPKSRNAEAAGWVEIDTAGPRGPRFAPVRLAAGAERDAVIRAAWTQQPFPANLLYRAARRHVAAVGVYHRLEPIGMDTSAVPEPSAPLKESREPLLARLCRHALGRD